MRSETSPTARALLTLEVLQNNPGITSARLAERLGVSTRAVRRYVEILREADIPVLAVRGPAGGYRLGRGVRLPPLVFDAPEALGLVMAVLDGAHDANADDAVGRALGKLLGALPASVAEHADAVRRATAPAPDRAAARPDPETTVRLVQACAERRRLLLGYRSEKNLDMELAVEPWAVVVRHGRWYLLCRSMRSEGVRAYRVDRVQTVEPLAHAQTGEQTFEPPVDLDPVACLEEHLGVGWAYEADVLVEAPLHEAGRYLSRVLGRLEPIDEHRCRLRGTTGNPHWYAEQLTRLPHPFRIEGCPELRDAVASLARRLAAAADIGADADADADADGQLSSVSGLLS